MKKTTVVLALLIAFALILGACATPAVEEAPAEEPEAMEEKAEEAPVDEAPEAEEVEEAPEFDASVPANEAYDIVS